MSDSREATARANANIALVKYWGKRDARLNLPAAGSLSATLAGLCTTTTVRFEDAPYARDRLLIADQQAPPSMLKKALRVVNLLRTRAGLDAAVTIRTHNDFPTGAGLASSASGLAALAVATAAAAGLELAPHELSRIARQGSGSACRSLYGGFVRWDAGEAKDGSDSFARPLYPAEHWEALRVVVALVSTEPKPRDSTSGMTHTAATSPYHAAFVASVDADLDAAEAAIAAHDIEALGRVAERSCLRMHADMLAAEPPLLYLQPLSWRVLSCVRELQEAGEPLFFTVDAGPNIKIFCLEESVPRVRAALATIDELNGTIEARLGHDACVLL